MWYFRWFSWISFPWAPDYIALCHLNFSQNSRRCSQIWGFSPVVWDCKLLLWVVTLLCSKSTEEWTNRNQKFSQWTKRKQQEYKINVWDMSPINTNMFLPLPHSKWQWRQLVKSLSWEFKTKYSWIFSVSSIYFNSISWPMPEIIDPAFAKTSRKRSFSVIQNERFVQTFSTRLLSPTV